MKTVYKDKRFGWLTRTIRRNKYTVGAEIGCFKGNTTGFILDRCPNLRLYAVDLWSLDGYVGTIEYDRKIVTDINFDSVKKKFDRAIRGHQDRVTVLRGISWEMATKVADNSLDFVFIDANHDYKCVVKDIKAWAPKLKPGGMLSGHDYFNHPVCVGVIQAVDELTTNVRLEVDHVWWCKKEDVK